ncbi:Rho/RAC guanine nucleotide exchange factor, putative [Entamoeba histolytica HM-3:IMSS]|uniref:Rho/RAC guanine nucleotide exchange factor, putative n=1 Tax=Entamoeba histolytica HM-3:IMSS TaxID=885315 RepID=M7WWN3_ENTHI|nr:Rho/RAC guanine nucleotide exchange factor, putative [Entamoeba histolytica HM-3:IMSS]
MESDDQFIQFIQKKMVLISWMETILKVPINPDLCNSLKSGTILCYLAKTIDDDLIPVIHDSKHPYKQLENLNMFLQVCKEMHVPLLRIATHDDFVKGNIVRIVECVFLFATECFKIYNIEPFPQIPIEEVKKNLPSGQEAENIKEQLKYIQRTVIGGKIRVSASVFRTTLQFLMSTTKGFDMNVFEGTIAKAQAYFRRFSAKNEMNSLKKKNAFRIKVTHEMVKTEDDYVHYLKEGIDKYRPIIQSFVENGALKKDSVQIIFNNMEEIYQFNSKFLNDLKKATEDMKPNKPWINVYKELEGALSVYTPYLVNYSESIERVEQILCIECVRDALMKEKGNDKDMSSYLIMPIQRLPRYVLLLNELKKHTWNDHPDANNLVEMVSLIKKVTTTIDETKTKADSERVKPKLFDKFKPGKFGDITNEEILYITDFKLKGCPVSAILTQNLLAISNKENLIRFVFPISRITLLPCNSKKDSIKIRVRTKSKIKLQGTKLVPDGGLIRMVNDLKKLQSASVPNFPLTESCVVHRTTELHSGDIDRSIDPEEELMKRRKDKGGRMSIYSKRPIALTNDQLPFNSSLLKVPMEKKNRCSEIPTDNIKSIEEYKNDRQSECSRKGSVSGTDSPSSFKPKLTISVNNSKGDASKRDRRSLCAEITLKVSKHGGNNDLTKNMLREKNVQLVDGKRTLNSLGLEVYSFRELENKPDGIAKDDLVFHLSDEDFIELFDVTFDMFKSWKQWKQQTEKQKAGLW